MATALLATRTGGLLILVLLNPEQVLLVPTSAHQLLSLLQPLLVVMTTLTTITLLQLTLLLLPPLLPPLLPLAAAVNTAAVVSTATLQQPPQVTTSTLLLPLPPRLKRHPTAVVNTAIPTRLSLASTSTSLRLFLPHLLALSRATVRAMVQVTDTPLLLSPVTTSTLLLPPLSLRKIPTEVVNTATLTMPFPASTSTTLHRRRCPLRNLLPLQSLPSQPLVKRFLPPLHPKHRRTGLPMPTRPLLQP